MAGKSFGRLKVYQVGDRIGADIAEGRQSYADNRRFIRTARGSLNEARHFLRCAQKRKRPSRSRTDALQINFTSLPKMLNACPRPIGSPLHSNQ
jgi:four helix bundle protein